MARASKAAAAAGRLRLAQLAATGLSANAALRQLASEGLGMRRSTFLDLWRSANERIAQSERVLRLGPDVLPPSADIEVMQSNRRRGYQYTIQAGVPGISVPGEQGGPAITEWRYGTVYSRRRLTPSEAISAYQEMMSAPETGTQPGPILVAFVTRVRRWR